MGSDINVNETPKRHVCGRDGSKGVLIMSVSSIFSEKSRGNKVWRGRIRRRRRIITIHFGRFWHHCKKAVRWWLYATLFISNCSHCRGQHADVNIWSIPLFLRFSWVANKKLSYRRGTARCVVSVEILPIATQQYAVLLRGSWQDFCHAVGKISTDTTHRAVPRRQLSCLFLPRDAMHPRY